MTIIVLLLVCVASLLAGGSAPPNQLTAEEKAAGWVLLFDGKSFADWEGFNDTAVARQSWGIDDGAIRTLGDSSGGDIVTVRPYENFELQFEWKLSAGGNSGVKYLVQREWISPAFTPDSHFSFDSANHRVASDAFIYAGWKALKALRRSTPNG